jgi:hypothetical protein
MGTADMRGTAYGPTGLLSSSYISVGDGGAMYQSTYGADWTAVTGSGITSPLNAAVYALGNFITVGAAGSIFYSSDTISWPAAPSNTTQNLNAVATSGGLAVAVGDGGTILYTASPAGWGQATGVPTSNNLYGVTYSSNGWFAVGAGGVMLTSTDGITNWTAVTTGAPAVDLKSIAFRPAVAIVDPVTKIATLYPAALVAVGVGGTVLTSTTTNPSWTAQTLSPAADLSAVVPTASQFLAVGAGGVAFASQDGSTWTPRTTGTSANLLGLFDAQGQYIAVGQGGATLYSR